VITYEDFGTGKRAKKGLDYVAETLSSREDGELQEARIGGALHVEVQVSFRRDREVIAGVY
jgi:hypothetical protein